MLYVDNLEITDPCLNLAIEEYLLRHVQLDEPLLLFYINEPSVIIGRNQNTIEEIDPDYIRKNRIHVVRRLSGGGAVYHDLGNLNFSFVTPGKEGLHDFARFTEPVIAVLNELEVQAELRGKSDIFAAGKKISGNAQYASAGRMFSHGTLLFDMNIEHMLKALNPRQAMVQSKAVQSVRNFVTNIRELLQEEMEIQELRQALLEGIFGADEIQQYPLDEKEWNVIQRIAEERYRSWEWNYGRSPAFNVRKTQAFPMGKIDARIEVAQGRIKNIKFYGDFSGRRDVVELEAHLTGLRYDGEALAHALADLDVSAYFGGLDMAALRELLY